MVDEQSGPSAAAGLPTLSVGALLAEARAGLGRELVDIARETRVPLRHLMAIEADDHNALPALPYALGFAKAFARAVKLDPEAIGARFRAETRLLPHVPTSTQMEPMDEAQLPSRGLALGALAALVLVLGGLGLYGSGAFDPAPPPAKLAAAAPAAPAAAGPDVPTAPATSAAPGAAVSAQPAALPTSGAVVLTARQDVWVRIYDRATRRRAFMGVLSTGQSYTVPDGAVLVLRAGRAGVIEVRVAGMLLPPLGQTNQTIDGVVLTAPALAERLGVAIAPVQAPASPGSAQVRGPGTVAGPSAGA